MGLDQYLNGTVYVSQNDWKAFESLPPEQQDFNKIPRVAEFNAIAEAVGISNFIGGGGTGISVEFPVGYWRKANQIHNWFVKNVQRGDDDCGSYYVSRQDLEVLKDTCKTVLADNSLAMEELPPQSGFFFGSTEIDEFYLSDLENTIEIIDRCLAMPDFIDFKYSSSW